jgi:hypothetical protein
MNIYSKEMDSGVASQRNQFSREQFLGFHVHVEIMRYIRISCGVFFQAGVRLETESFGFNMSVKHQEMLHLPNRTKRKQFRSTKVCWQQKGFSKKVEKMDWSAYTDFKLI